MIIKNKNIYKRAMQLLQEAYGVDAAFREGQYEAIESVFINQKSLVVQKTGWGKSLVYFLATRLNREKRAGVTIVVSPLLALMQNQIEAAQKLGLRCEVLNSDTKDRRQEILLDIKQDKYDLILITPETLFSDEVQRALSENAIRIGLFVIDEAHCISDWGHDFRLEFGQINQIVKRLSAAVPILCTTATANERVINDLIAQLGEGVYISRGSLFRESLAIQVMEMGDRAERYAWILKHINSLPGSGIIYCLTTRDCDYLAEFLIANGVNAVSYHSAISKEINTDSERRFRENKIKALVATIKLGMGYDKDDIGFVIHFQRPANIVSYYQQIGRAGRKLPYAYVFLMSGAEDDEIHNFFIDTAFPYEDEALDVLKVIEENPDCTLRFILSKANLKYGRVEKTIGFLAHDGYIFDNKRKYIRSAKRFEYNRAHFEEIKQIRKLEQENMLALIKTNICYSRFIINALDDTSPIVCGKCSNCIGHDIIDRQVSIEEKEFAARQINARALNIAPRFYWAETALTKYGKMEHMNEPGFCIAIWGHAGYGEIIKKCKRNNEEYPLEIIQRAVEILKQATIEFQPLCVTHVPSKNDARLAQFAQKLAEHLGLSYKPLLKKVRHNPQKSMMNGSQKCYNAQLSYEVLPSVPSCNILLVDDTVDSGWTLTVCGHALRKMGALSVVPLALAENKTEESR